MLYLLLFFLLMVSQALGDCVKYTFEDDYHDLFRDDSGLCSSANVQSFWNLGNYEDLNISGPTGFSSKFISPQQTLSCVSSFVFPMAAGGVIELNIFMNILTNADGITVVAHETGNNGAVGTATTTTMQHFVPGWYTLRFTLGHMGAYDGYLSIMGIRSSASIVLLDSFRYIPPGMDGNDCQLYKLDTTTESITDYTDANTTEDYKEGATESAMDSTTESQPIESSTEDLDNNTDSETTTETKRKRKRIVVKVSTNVKVSMFT